jgi:hypothetical protein
VVIVPLLNEISNLLFEFCDGERSFPLLFLTTGPGSGRCSSIALSFLVSLLRGGMKRKVRLLFALATLRYITSRDLRKEGVNPVEQSFLAIQPTIRAIAEPGVASITGNDRVQRG